MTPKDRILFVLKEKGIKSASEITDSTDKMYHNIYKQLFSDNVKNISSDMIAYILEKFPDISADYVIRGEGSWERKTHIVTTTKQEIHSDGAPIAITQAGDANVQAQKKEQAPEAPAPVDIDKMFRDKDWNMVVSLIRQHDQEIIALKDQRIAELEQELSMLTNLIKGITTSVNNNKKQ